MKRPPLTFRPYVQPRRSSRLAPLLTAAVVLLALAGMVVLVWR